MREARPDYSGIKALVVGLGDTGLSCVRWLLRHGAQVRATDTRATPPHGERLRAEHPELAMRLGSLDEADFRWADLVVTSPGVPVTTPQIAAAARAGKDVVGDVELFARALPALCPDVEVLAITGSNGKSTVTALTGHLCTTAGRASVTAGNIGLPVLDALTACLDQGRMPQTWVLELSSFQLETTTSLAPTAATVLNLSQDHLDRYAGMADYAAAKARIFAGTGVQVLNRDDPRVMKMALPGRTLWTFGLNTGLHRGEWGLTDRGHDKWLAEGLEPLLPVDHLPMAGLHNAANALASLALCRALDLPYPYLLEGLATFRGLPHRLEPVARIGAVTWYDDSKGTNVGATVAALNGLPCPVVLIAGGEGKGQDFTPLRDALRHARAVVLIGRDAPLIEAAIAGVTPVEHAASMAQAVARAHALAQPGDAVLLSPACASFDMFRNYVHRAEVFVAAVRSLEAASGRPPQPSSDGGGRVS